MSIAITVTHLKAPELSLSSSRYKYAMLISKNQNQYKKSITVTASKKLYRLMSLSVTHQKASKSNLGYPWHISALNILKSKIDINYQSPLQF